MSDEKVLEIVCDFANAIEAAAVNMKHQIAELTGVATPSAAKEYDTEKITWLEKTGVKGPYQYADPKTEGSKADFKALLKDLKGHDSKFRHGGMFYWVFRDAAGIGRKQV